MNYHILRFPEAIELTGLSRSTIYKKIADGTFPKPMKLSTRAVGFSSSELNDWINSLQKVACKEA